MKGFTRQLFSIIGVLALLAGPFGSTGVLPVQASHTPDPGTVTLVGSLQSELGCGGDWQEACSETHLALDADDQVWQRAWTVPAGNWEYKAALNDSWSENYGQHAQPGGSNVPLALAADTPVKFYYDHETHWITDSVSSVIATVPGSFQSELGCPGDWAPECLRSWLQDPDGDGIYAFSTSAIPEGSYEAKVAINETWDLNYGQNGAQNGGNIVFTVPANATGVDFRWDSTTHVLSIEVHTPAGHALDNNVEWDGLRHDSRDLLYRTPGGAVPAGTPVKIRFRTFHNDVSAVTLRAYDVDAGAQVFYTMAVAASGVTCAQAGLESDTCDYWEAVLPNDAPSNLWYRFLVTDGSKTVFYADNTAALDGGLGAPSDELRDNSYALMVYDPAFESPEWAKDAVIYQIFPDRFRNGSTRNDPKTGMVRYDDPAIQMAWNALPEGYCRNYADGSTNCPWRFDTTPPDWSPTKEGPRGRDYYGGDLRGVIEKLDYLQELGVTVIYFNPIFEAKSNHRYDTSNYRTVDHNLGTLKEFDELVRAANQRGIRIVLDGVFNHMSSDSPFFDRYGHYAEVGACESTDSAWRAWFNFRAVEQGQPAPCAPNHTYDGWFGFDSIPVIDKTNPDVVSYFITGRSSITRIWLKRGADGWRMDVMGDASFPNGYWEAFRSTVKSVDPQAVIIGELWQKDSTLLRYLRGDRADTTMNYRLRDAVIGLLAPGAFDSKGFADSGRLLAPSEFAARLESVREDYPDAAYFSLMNLLDSHDTERLLWTLTPGSETTADKELNAENVAAGKQRVRLASLIQFTVPGAPTIYYGDEVGITGDDDPDDRRTYPWEDTGGTIDAAMLAHYQALASVRRAHASLMDGELTFLLTDDAARVLAYGRKTGDQASLVALNLGSESRVLDIPVAGYLPEGTALSGVLGVGVDAPTFNATVTGGMLQVTLPAMSAVVLATGTVDLTAPEAPANLRVTAEGPGSVSLAWDAVADAAGYAVYRSVLSGGGWVLANSSPVTTTEFTDSGLPNAQTVYYIVRALDAAGNESAPSNEVSGLPHLSIGWANLQWPPSLVHTISAVNRTGNVYGQVWIDGATAQPGPTPALLAQLGYGPRDSQPDGSADWLWVDAVFNVDNGNNDEFMASLLPESVGEFDYAFRYSTTAGASWVYADLDGTGDGYDPADAGKLTVNSSGDVDAPTVPTGLHIVSASPAGIELAWDAIVGDASLYGYEVLRGETSGGPYSVLATVTGNSYTDTAVAQGITYYYAVRALDASFNRSGLSGEVSAVAQLRTVSVVFNVTVPATTDGTGRIVHIAGSLDRLDGGLPQWNPGGVQLTRVDATHWTITLTGLETTQIEYKYALGSWDYVEKGAACDELGNRILSLAYGDSGVQTVNDTVLNWRNVAPCGN